MELVVLRDEPGADAVREADGYLSPVCADEVTEDDIYGRCHETLLR
jgi:hypothetical protein